MKKRYENYGCGKFDKQKFKAIKNDPYMTKPTGGFWASPVGAENSWYKWVKENSFSDYSNMKPIVFTLKDGAKVLQLRTPKDLEKLPKVDSEIARERRELGHVFLDFEELVRQGVDAIEIEIPKLYYALFTWDCDSILVMNPGVIEIEEE